MNLLASFSRITCFRVTIHRTIQSQKRVLFYFYGLVDKTAVLQYLPCPQGEKKKRKKKKYS